MEERAERRTVDAAASSAELAAAVRRERQRRAEALHDDALQRVLVARRDPIEAEGSLPLGEISPADPGLEHRRAPV